VIISNFDAKKSNEFVLRIPSEIIKKWNLKDGIYQLNDELYNAKYFNLEVNNSLGNVKIGIKPLESFILKLL
jgi:hypothetical protein